MTREEFVKAAEKALSVEALTDLYVRAGMLKLDEPKSDSKTAAQRLSEELDACGYSTGEINEFFDCAARANVKIVEK